MKKLDFKKNISFKFFFLSQGEILFLFFILIAGSLLLFLNLGNIYLWQDEAQTALISETVLQYGVPKGYDGKNFLSQELGIEYGENYIWKWHTWFPFYLLAAFFKIFGTNSFTARLPFAMFGLGCLFLIYFFSKSLWNDKKVAVMSASALLFSVPFLILSRQCRYYSLTAFFSLGGLYGYQAMTRGKRFGPFVYLVASTFLFHTHYIYLATMLATVAVHVLIFQRNLWKKVLLWTLGILVLNSPWIIWLSGMKYGENYDMFKWDPFVSQMMHFMNHIRQHLFPIYLFLVPLGVLLWYWFRNKEFFFRKKPELLSGIFIPVFFVFINMVALSLVAPAPFFRYLAPVLPFLAIVVGLFLAWAAEMHLIAGISILACLIVSGPIFGFMYEITHDYDGPIEGIVEHLNKHAKKTDVVAITYGDMPVKFYTGLRVVGGLTGEDLTPGADADWVVIRRNVICEKDHKVRNFLASQVKWRRYQKITLNYPDIPFENRESPLHHLYRTQLNYPPVILFRKVK
ncbi:MAG: hypothetical protein GY749_45730 [Desulfobacteraceae bacterium]|nr:hypothetical protein [Desulfobacteraceae bacterium]